MIGRSFHASANPDMQERTTPTVSHMGSRGDPLSLIGRDLARDQGRSGIPTRVVVLMMLITALAGLGIVGVRSDVMRIRYALSEAMAEEKRLRVEHNASTVEMRRLRSPARLSSLAQELGFRRPEKIVDLSMQPATSGSSQTTRGNP